MALPALRAQSGTTNPAALAAAVVRPAPSPEVAHISDEPDAPVEMLDLMNRSHSKYEEGAGLIRMGDRAKARAAFDAAVDMVLKSSYSLRDTPALDRYFQELVQQIQDEEARFQPSKDAEEPSEGAVVDELDKLDLIPITVDPSLRNVVEEDLAKTRYDIPVMLNERVLKSLDFWLTRGRKFFTDGLIRSGRYQEMIERVFREAAIPRDVMYLAQVESLFKTNALSRAQCKGIWQFGKWTAIRYGLKVNDYVDERSDPEKSTRAAARYLNDLYSMFQDWNLVLAAYNWGEGKVQRLMDRSGLNDFWDLANLPQKRKLPTETKNHVPLIMASIILARNPERYGLPTELDQPLRYERTAIPHSIDLREAAKVLEVPFEQLKELNPSIRTHVTPAAYPDFELKIPVGTGLEATGKLATLPEAKLVVRSARVRHKVKPGETLTQVAARYKVSVWALQAANGSKPLRAGTWLDIPVKPRAQGTSLTTRRKPSGVKSAAARPTSSASAARRTTAHRSAKAATNNRKPTAVTRSTPSKKPARAPAVERASR
jgi:membrane-bound lytic murein transglycosylase D